MMVEGAVYLHIILFIVHAAMNFYFLQMMGFAPVFLYSIFIAQTTINFYIARWYRASYMKSLALATLLDTYTGGEELTILCTCLESEFGYINCPIEEHREGL